MSEIRVPNSWPDTHFPVNRSTEISLKIKMFGERRLRKLKRGALCLYLCGCVYSKLKQNKTKKEVQLIISAIN